MTEQTYARRPGTVAANLGEELAVLDLPSGSYLGFNATAAHVWRSLEQPMTLTALCAAMTAEFAIDAGQCRTDVSALLDRLTAAGLVTVDG